MAKYFGAIGYSVSVEVRPGVYDQQVVEREYTGDVVQRQRRWEAGELMNDDLTVSNRISIVADDYAYENAGNMRYVRFLGTVWKIRSLEFERPRIAITLGGVYNGPVAT